MSEERQPLNIDESNGESILQCTEDGLTLMGNGQTLRGDFAKLTPRLKRENLSRELLIRALRGREKNGEYFVVDATAGLGEDSFLLAASGCRVVMYENDPMIAALLRDAMERAATEAGLAPIIARMTLVEGNSIEELPRLVEKPDVVYLDPMFPKRSKSGLVKKKFQVIHTIEAPCDAEVALLDAAVAAGPKKIIVKRPIKAPPLGNRRPTYSIEGKTIRYDCIVLPDD